MQAPWRNGLSETQQTGGGRKLPGVVLLKEIRSPSPSPVALVANGLPLDSQNHKLHVGSLSRMPEIEQVMGGFSHHHQQLRQRRKGTIKIFMVTMSIISSQI